MTEITRMMSIKKMSTEQLKDYIKNYGADDDQVADSNKSVEKIDLVWMAIRVYHSNKRKRREEDEDGRVAILVPEESEEEDEQTIQYIKQIEEGCPDAHNTIWRPYRFSYEPKEPKIKWGDLDQEVRMYGSVKLIHARYEYYYNMYHTLMREKSDVIAE